MADELIVLNKVQKFLKEQYQNVGDNMIAGSINICWDRHMPTNIFHRKSLTC